jgi:protein-tyrosine-phosphatase/predicted ATP-grasp superfamily ATP-dependent carboligase
MSIKNKVLVIGDDTRSFLSTVRSLGRQGLEVHVAPFDFRAPALASRYIHATHFLPYYLDGGQAWLDAVLALLREHDFSLVVPCDERGLLPLCLHRDALGAFCPLAIPSAEALDIYFDKVRTRALAQSVDVPVAPGRLLAVGDTADGIAAEFGLPVVIKEPMSYAMPELYVRTSTRIIGERAELAAWLALGVSVLCHDGAVLQAFEHHRAHEMNGSSYYRKSAPLDPQRLAAVERMVRASRYTGLAMFEFKVDPATDGWILIEVNARPWGSLPLPVSIGVDFPYRLYRLLALGEPTAPVDYPAGRYCRNLILDMWQARAGAARLARRPVRLALHCLAWGWSFHRVLIGREHQDTLVLDDAGPGWQELRELVGGRVKRRAPAQAGQSLSARMASLFGANPNRPLNVLYVCQGNINRSSYAHLKSGELFGASAQFDSAGMLPRNRRGSPAVAIAAAAQRGVDMSTHRSRHASRAMLEAADLVIVFDQINLESIAARYPDLRDRVFLLGQACTAAGSDCQILDPEGKDASTFNATYGRIDECLTALAQAAPASANPVRDSRPC